MGRGGPENGCRRADRTVAGTVSWGQGRDQPFTAPSMMPFTKYRCMKGYTSRIGMMVIMAMVYLVVTPLLARFWAVC